jgi:predicted  nucleic acid-binding Zn-ribbon protein
MKRILVTILFIFFISGNSFAEVYKWVDEKGVVYFTDDITQVPEKYRSRAEKIGLPEEKGETKVEGELMPKRKEETYRDRLGRGEDYWKGRVEEWRKKLKELQDKLEILRGKYNGLTEKYNDSKSTAERGNLRRERDQVKSEMDQCKIQIEEARNMLEKKIPEEADLYKAKPEWVKQ